MAEGRTTDEHVDAMESSNTRLLFGVIPRVMLAELPGAHIDFKWTEA
jgi:hypothetical protein